MVRVNWRDDARELKEFLVSYREAKGFSAHWTAQLNGYDQYFRKGVTWSSRPHRIGSFWALPEGSIFGNSGPGLMDSDDESLYFDLAVLNSRIYLALLNLLMPRGTHGDGQTLKYELGYVRAVPFPSPTKSERSEIANKCSQICALLISSLQDSERYIGFHINRALKPLGDVKKNHSETLGEKVQIANDIITLEREIETLLITAYQRTCRVSAKTLVGLCSTVEEQIYASTRFSLAETTKKEFARRVFSLVVGTAFGRYKSNSDHIHEQDPFAKIEFPKVSGSKPILSSDSSQQDSLVQAISDACDDFDGGGSGSFLESLEAAFLEEGGILGYANRGFFSDHLSEFSAARRNAPIYWPISTSSGSYTLWLYYPSLTDQTLFTAVNDFIEPKLKQVGQDVAALRTKGSARSRDDEKNFEALQTLELELIELRDTLLAIAQTYRPNHDDGVQITAAPLWQLFRHKPWQKILKDTWAKLEKGDYDWAHLALAYWPYRVHEKCKTDKSLAIAHDLEHLYVEPAPKPTKARGRKKNG